MPANTVPAMDPRDVAVNRASYRVAVLLVSNGLEGDALSALATAILDYTEARIKAHPSLARRESQP